MTVVENRFETTHGGVTGRGFVPGQSGNPGGRPKGLTRRVREIVGEDGESIIEFMAGVMHDETARKADRLEAAKWLADRGFGRAIQGLEIDVAHGPSLDITRFSTEDLEAMVGILEKYEPNVAEMAASGEIPLYAPPASVTGHRHR